MTRREQFQANRRAHIVSLRCAARLARRFGDKKEAARLHRMAREALKTL